ncbi:6985_t:CDS:2 [Paraglomus occultum]|uniref:6985_t:CDS:1 n=1 Tax=Paraglomus occultum TaxID=144539 RepID=A0A9N8W6H4_9GLOM|nr:6985_t:CDS:2 [Paraglomus occultum]
MSHRNKQELEIKEKQHFGYLEGLANTWQKYSEAKKERLKKEEEQRIKQEKQQTQEEETKKKNQEEEIQQKEQEFKNRVEEEGKRQESSPKINKETKDLKDKTSLDNNLQDAKTELQTIQSKATPYQHQIALIISRGETTKEKLEGLEKHELENCKKALEELKEIIHLFDSERHLLKEINNKLKVLNLEEEIKQLKSSKIKNPQQQEEIQKKIEEKEKELEEIRKRFKSEENKQFEISPQIFSKFSSLSNFDTKENVENLINPIKDNPEFLQEIQTKYQIEDLDTFITTKSPEEIIKIIKRFEFDNLSSSDKEDKIKKMKAYYQQLNELAKNGKLTEEQIDKYLYKEATKELESERNSITNQDEQKANDSKNNMNKKEKIEDLLKQVEQKKVLRSQYIEKEKKLTDEINKLLKDAEALVEELKKEKVG